MTIDLDAARAARAETLGEPETVILGGDSFTLPLECPMAFAEALQQDNVRASVYALFGETEGERFLKFGLSVPDMVELVTQAARHYGLGSPGESVASNGSSPNSSRPSKRTSSRSTG